MASYQYFDSINMISRISQPFGLFPRFLRFPPFQPGLAVTVVELLGGEAAVYSMVRCEHWCQLSGRLFQVVLLDFRGKGVLLEVELVTVEHRVNFLGYGAFGDMFLLL